MMSIKTEEISDREFAIILDKQFDFNCVEDFRKAYDSQSNGKRKQYIVDFKYTQYIDSSALGMLINMQKKLSQSGATVKLINPNEQVKKLFVISHFDKKFEIQ